MLKLTTFVVNLNNKLCTSLHLVFVSIVLQRRINRLVFFPKLCTETKFPRYYRKPSKYFQQALCIMVPFLALKVFASRASFISVESAVDRSHFT